MTAEPVFTFATTTAEPDKLFGTLDSLAREILRAAGGAALRLKPATVHRGRLPEGVAVAVRRRDGEEGGYGRLLGYAFLPPGPAPVGALQAAIDARLPASQRSAAA